MRQPTSDNPSMPGRDPVEGRPDMDLPGADHANPIVERRPGEAPDRGDGPRPDREPPDSPGADLPERLGERAQDGVRLAGEPDLVPDVEVPEETM